MKYGYARVSSTGQALYGTSIEHQEAELKENGAEVVYKEVYTGMSAERPELDKLLSVVKDGDTIIVSKMDRLGRCAEDIIHLIKQLVGRGITVNILNMGVANNTLMGRFMVNILSCVAEFEHDMILSRLNDGKAARKAADPTYKEGRKTVPYDEEKFLKIKKRVDAGALSVSEACREVGISRAKWYRLAN